mgnify:CR=1 FL=1
MKKYKPRTPSLRSTSTVPYSKLLTPTSPVKSLTHGGRRSVGRNNQGRITTRHKGSGHKRRYREVNFSNNPVGIPGTIKTIEYDPNRSGFIALIAYRSGQRAYVLVPQGLKPGDAILFAPEAEIAPGNRLPLARIPVGTFVYNVEVKPGGGAKLARGAGVHAEVVARDAGYVDLKMPSTEVRKVREEAWASIGAVSNEAHQLAQFGKAGRSRWKGIRPTVRGSAMNPVDHPYGGGEGRQGRGTRRAKSLWGKPTGKGQKTRRAKKYSNALIVSRRRVGKKRLGVV